MSEDITNNIKKLILPVASILALLFCLYLTTRYSFLLFHTLTEFFSIAVVFAIFLIAWNARKFATNSYLLFIGFSCFFVGTFDLLHVIAYQGMKVFYHNDPDLGTQLWVCARFLQASSFLIAPFLIGRKLRTELIFTVFTFVSAAILVSIFYFHIFPVCFIEGKGLTNFKKNCEYLICLMFLAAIIILYFKRGHFSKSVVNTIITSLALMVMMELVFTGYISTTGPLNIAGHYLKITALFLLYRVLVKSQISNPFETMFLDIKQHETVLTKTLETAKARTAEVTSLLDITTNILVSQSFEESAANILLRSLELTNAGCGYVLLSNGNDIEDCRVIAERGTSLFISQNSFIKFFTDRRINNPSDQAIFCANDIEVSLVNGTIKNVVSSPLVVDGKVSGWIVLLNKPADFTRNDLRMLSSFSELCSIALQSSEATKLLKESEERFELFMDNLPASAYIKNEKGDYLFANKYFEDNFCSYDIDSHKMAIDKMPAEIIDKIKREDSIVFSTGKILEETLTMPSKGTDKIYMVKKFPLLGNSSSPLIGSIAIDITEKYRYEEILKREQEKLGNILNSMENGVIIVGQDFEIKYVNPAMSRSFGKLGGKKCYEYLCGLGQPCGRCDFAPILKGQAIHSEYFNNITNRVYDSVETPYIDTFTGELCKLKMLWDITDIKKAQEEIKSLSLFPSENPHPIMRISKDGEIMYANKPGCDVLENWSVRIGDRIPAEWFELIKKAYRDGNNIIKEADVRDRVIAFTIAPLISEGYANIYGRDITEYKNAEKELLEANNELERRVQLRTKQLNETVDALRGEVYERIAAEKELLENQKRLRSLSQELVLTEERQRHKFAVELHDSIGQLLAFSKKELGTVLEKSPGNIEPTVRKVWESIRESIDLTRRLTFDLSSPTLYTLGLQSAIEELAEEFSKEHKYQCVLSSCRLPGDIAENIQIFIFRSIRELLINAAKHANARNVEIAISSKGNIIKVVVEDDGVGFDADQIENNRTAVKSFGLFSVRESLNNFGGKLEIGMAEKEGTRIVMYIPYKEQESDEQ